MLWCQVRVQTHLICIGMLLVHRSSGLDRTIGVFIQAIHGGPSGKAQTLIEKMPIRAWWIVL
jgi:hypothetical protein